MKYPAFQLIRFPGYVTYWRNIRILRSFVIPMCCSYQISEKNATHYEVHENWSERVTNRKKNPLKDVRKVQYRCLILDNGFDMKGHSVPISESFVSYLTSKSRLSFLHKTKTHDSRTRKRQTLLLGHLFSSGEMAGGRSKISSALNRLALEIPLDLYCVVFTNIIEHTWEWVQLPIVNTLCQYRLAFQSVIFKIYSITRNIPTLKLKLSFGTNFLSNFLKVTTR